MYAKFVAAISDTKRLWTVLLVFAGLLLLLRILAGPSSAQTPSSAEDNASRNERILESLIKNDVPIKIKIKQEREASFKDLQNEKWLSEFELELTNTGDKPIYFLYITMGTGVNVGGQEIVFPLHHGRPELGDIVTKAEPDDVPIKPGETYVMKVGGGPAWERGVREKRWPQATRFRAELQALSFGDGTGYFGNQPYPPLNRRQSAPTDQVQQPEASANFH